MKVKIGVLAIQGAIQEHVDMLMKLEAEVILVKTKEDLEGLDGLILPGGESTAIGKLLRDYDMLQPIIDKAREGMQLWGTCAGMILLAKNIDGQNDCHLGLMDINVVRNGYGSQLDSFVKSYSIPEVYDKEIPLVFIRAPYIQSVWDGVRVLAKVDGRIVAAEQENMLATSFHPELTEDLSFHRYFVEKVVRGK